ncbi:acyltransferase family protein [Mycolicibacterium anyangense]|uniref:acyltransferase family protein n=1 Tax=Mycolicibacterium anyangense TaxID=1431246 RepID=UPI001FEBAE9E|nr:acyltransferase family protein [Mycolicibacterium anyangense]
MSPAEGLDSQLPAQSTFRPDIEGLRAVAVLAVVLFHAAVPGLGGGYVGVDIFFVISGFLITGLLWREAQGSGTVRLRNFYGARARRLLPASALVGIVTMVAAALLLPPLLVRSVIGDGIASALYVSNCWFVVRGVDYFATHVPPSPFQHYWSLGVEEQFYLVWPALILGTAWLIRKLRRRNRIEATASQRPYLVVLTVVAVLSFAMSFVATYVSPATAFFSLPTRAWQLALGGMIALTAGRWRQLSPRAAAVVGWSGLAMILVACTVLTESTLYPGSAALLPTVGSALVIGAGCALPAGGCGQLLGLAPMRAIGRISYSWYLWHWPVLVLAPALVGHPLSLPARLAAAALSGVLAVLTLRYLENPLRFATKIRTSAWRSLGLGAVATATAVVAGLGLLAVTPTPVGRGAPATALNFTEMRVPPGSGAAAYDTAVRQAFAQVQAAVAGSANLRSVPSNLIPALADAPAERSALAFGGCMRSPFESGHPECASVDVDSPTTVALVGDSHAAMWNPAFEKIAGQRRWRLELLSKGACPMVDVPIGNPLRQLADGLQHCREWRNQILARLRAERPALVVLSMWRGYGADESWTGYTAFDPVWLDRLTRVVRELRDNGSRVLVLGPVPDPHFVVPICLSGYLDDVAACTPARATAVHPAGIAAETAATEAGGGQYADLTDLFCTSDHCPVIVGNTLVYLDENHVTLEYSRALAPVIATLADRSLAVG